MKNEDLKRKNKARSHINNLLQIIINGYSNVVEITANIRF